MSPHIFQTTLHISPEKYGQLMMLPAIAYIVGNFIAMRLNRYLHYPKIIMLGILMSLSGAVSLSFLSLAGLTNITLLVSCITLVIFGYSFSASYAVTGAISLFRHTAGAASSLLGFLQMVGSSLCVTIVSLFFTNNSTVLGVSFVIVTFIMFFFACVCLKRDREEDTSFEVSTEPQYASNNNRACDQIS